MKTPKRTKAHPTTGKPTLSPPAKGALARVMRTEKPKRAGVAMAEDKPMKPAGGDRPKTAMKRKKPGY